RERPLFVTEGLLVLLSFFSFICVGVVGRSENGVVSWGVRRVVLEGNSGENSSLILAAERTHRKDPLDNFKYYKRGWNISEEHYLSSAAFTAAPLFFVAAIWLVGFGLCLLFLCFCFCCCQRQPYGYSKTAYALSYIFIITFTVAAIIGCVVLYLGQGKFHGSTTDTLGYVVKQADNTVYSLRNVSEYLAAAKRVGVEGDFLPQDVQKNIDNVDRAVSASASTLENETKSNSDDIKAALNSVRLALIIIAAVMLLLAFLGFLFSILGLQFLVYILMIIGWISVAVTFVLCGVFLALHNVVGDTCVAMDQWVQNPTAKTALDDILPCVDDATARDTLSQSRVVTFQLAGAVNRLIVNISNINPPPRVGPPLYYNQSGPLVPVLCNPFNPDKTDRKCAFGEVALSNATQVWRNYVCQVSENNSCTTVGRLTPTMYEQMTAAVNVSYGLYQYGPFLAGLLDCSFVRHTFSGIYNDHCPDLRLYSKWTYIGLAMVSAGVMLSVILWVLFARESRHRKYTKLNEAASAQNSFVEKGP
ncbi:hypothetical protein RJ639_018654, partial [Escallonia herrerae]